MTGRAGAEDLDVLALVARLRLAPPALVAALAGLGGRTRAHARLAALRADGLLAGARLRCRPAREPALLHLTDAGAAALAAAGGVPPRALVRRDRIDGVALRALAMRLGPHLGCCALLARAARARAGTPRLVAWAAPWRCAHPRRRRAGLGAAALPALAELAWPDGRERWVLLPDDPLVPPAVHRAGLVAIARRRLAGLDAPPLLIGVADGRRADVWRAALDAVARATGDAPPPAWIVEPSPARDAWSAGGARPPRAPQCCPPAPALAPGAVPDQSAERAALIGQPFEPGGRAAGPRDRLARAALALAPADRALLDAVGPRPTLDPPALAAATDASVVGTRARRDRLAGLGLVRVGPPARPGAEDATVLTAAGLAIAAAAHGLTPWQAARYLGYAADDPPRPGRPRSLGERRRRDLEQARRHTAETDAVYVAVRRVLTRWRRAGRDAALVEWRTAPASARGRFRPDGELLVRVDGALHRYFLEVDRATMKVWQLVAKVERYYRARDEAARRGESFPTLLLVTASDRALARLGRMLRELADGRAPLSVLLTTAARAARHRDRYLGPAWLEPATAACMATRGGAGRGGDRPAARIATERGVAHMRVLDGHADGRPVRRGRGA